LVSLPEFFLEKNDTCTIDSTFVDSAGTAWFLIRTGEKNGWSRAESIRFRVDNDKEPEEQNTDGLKKTERIKPD
jgi:hypothetical protein